MMNEFECEVYACDSDGYEEYFSSILQKKGTQKDKNQENTLSNKVQKAQHLSK